MNWRFVELSYGPKTGAFQARCTAIGTSEAGEARAMAKQMNSELSKKMMLKVADDYDGLADKAAVRYETKGSRCSNNAVC